MFPRILAVQDSRPFEFLRRLLPHLRRLSPVESVDAKPDGLTLWYRRPADRWLDAPPIGNGRLGAMVYGGGRIGFRHTRAICLWARPGHWDKAAEFFRKLVTESTNGTPLDICAGRSQICQIESNFGASAVLEEMLLQSQAGTIDRLPTLPAVWPSGPATAEWLHYSEAFAEPLVSMLFICKGAVRRMSRDEAPIWMV